MQMTLIRLAVLALALAFTSPALAYTYKTNSLCTTDFSSKSVASVKTTSYAVTIPITYQAKVTKTPTRTVTPSPETTIVDTTTTFTSTSTVSSTSVLTSTVLITITATETDYDTIITTATAANPVIVIPATVTIPTSPGFTPIASGIGYRARRRSAPKVAPPAIRGRPAIDESNDLSRRAAKAPKSKTQYPSLVKCGALVQAITTSTATVFAKTTATTSLAPSPVTSTNLVSATTTITTASRVDSYTTVTSTASASTTLTSTVTSEVLTTNTVIAPAPTAYAACQSNNIIGAANGNVGIDYFENYGQFHRIAPFTTAEDCCVTCQQAVNCQGFAGITGDACVFFTTRQNRICDGSRAGSPEDQPNVYYSHEGVEANSATFVGNGACGQFANAGSY